MVSAKVSNIQIPETETGGGQYPQEYLKMQPLRRVIQRFNEYIPKKWTEQTYLLLDHLNNLQNGRELASQALIKNIQRSRILAQLIGHASTWEPAGQAVTASYNSKSDAESFCTICSSVKASFKKHLATKSDWKALMHF
jgi:hypothetical protein